MQARTAVLIARGPDQKRPAFGPVAALPAASGSLLEHAVRALTRAGVQEIAVVVEEGAEDECARTVACQTGADSASLETFSQAAGANLEEALTQAQTVIGDRAFVLHLGDSLCWEPGLHWDEGAFDAADALILVQAAASSSGASAPSPFREPSAPEPDPPVGLGPRHLGVYLVGAEFGEAACVVTDRRGIAAQAKAAVSVLAQNGGRTHYTRQTESWRYSEAPGNLLEANQLALARLRPAPIAATVTDSELHGPIDIHPSAVLESSVVRGPVAIGPGTQIRDSYLGPYTTLGRDVEVEGAEVAYSVVMDGASVRHVRERLEASLVGPNARVCRDFKLPRALRLEVGARAEVVLA